MMTTNEAKPKPEYDPVKVLQEQAKDRPPGVPVVKIPRPAREGGAPPEGPR